MILIEILLDSKCTECNLCVKVCPTNVFEKTDNGAPIIARQSDCQTCYMCEVYCPAQALYVAPYAEEVVVVSEQDIVEANLFGSYRRSLGWEKGQKSTASQDMSYKVIARMSSH